MTEPLRVASYNIRKCVGLDRRRKPGRIVDAINRLEADVVALQEADMRMGNRPPALPESLIEGHTDLRVVHVAATGDSLGWHGNAFLVRKDLPVLGVQCHGLPGTEPRGALSVALANGAVIAGVHLGLWRGDRRRQLLALRRQLQDPANTIILGDFNEWSAKRGLEQLGTDYTVISPGRSFHAARPVAALDRFALGANLDLLDAGVSENRITRIASDHLPIWADVALKGTKVLADSSASFAARQQDATGPEKAARAGGQDLTLAARAR